MCNNWSTSSGSLQTNWPPIARFMGPIWGPQDPGGPHFGLMNLAIWDTKYAPGDKQSANSPAWNYIDEWGLWAFLMWWPPSTMWADPLTFVWCVHNPIFFSNLWLCAVCWSNFMCHHQLWSTSVSHPFSFLNSSLGLTGGKYYQKITIPIIRIILQNLAFPGCFSYILFYRYISL